MLFAFQNNNSDNSFQMNHRNTHSMSLVQLLSYTVIISAPLIGCVLEYPINEIYFTLMGIGPVILGLNGLYNLIKDYFYPKDDVMTNLNYYEMTENGEGQSRSEIDETKSDTLIRSIFRYFFHKCLSEIVLGAVIVGIVVGSDNICRYITLFTDNDDILNIAIIIFAFCDLLLFSIILGNYIANQLPKSTILINKLSPYFISPLLIGLGFYILSENRW